MTLRWLFLFLFLPMIALAQPIVTDVSSDEINITTNFDGTEIVVFGATDGTANQDVALIVRGPKKRMEVRKKGQRSGIWMTTDRMVFRNVPSVYHVASSVPLSQLADDATLDFNQIGIEHLDFKTSRWTSRRTKKEVVKTYRASLVENLVARDFYSDDANKITFKGGRLFKTKVQLPPEIPTGRYKVEAFLFQDGKAIAQEINTVDVRKVGFSARLNYYATNRSFVYGIIAVLVALIFGSTVGFLFKQK